MGGKKCSLTGLAFLCICNKSLDSKKDRNRFAEVVDQVLGVTSSAILCALSVLIFWSIRGLA